MLKVVKGDRPERPSSGLSDTLWDLLVATWVVQYARKPRERPLASAVLTRLKKCIGDWGKSIIPLIPEDLEDIGWCRISPNDYGGLFMSLVQTQVMMMILQSWQVIFSVRLANLLLTGDLNDLICSRTALAVSQLNRLALVETSRWLWYVCRCVLVSQPLL